MSSLDPWAPRENLPSESVAPAPQARTAPAAPSEPQSERRPHVPERTSTAQRGGSGIAADGRLLDPSHFPHKPMGTPPEDSALLGYVPSEEDFDFSDIHAVNQAINIARRRLFQATQELKHYQQEAAKAKYEWKSAVNRALVVMSGGTEKTRQAMAEIQTEDEYSAYLVAELAADSALTFLRSTRSDLDALMNVSHNVRAQMQVM